VRLGGYGGCRKGGSARAAQCCLPVHDCLLYVMEESRMGEGEEKSEKRKEEWKERKKEKEKGGNFPTWKFLGKNKR
jgi:predicted metal-binding transcription factor (methanogenesis marker protein 9)